MYVLGICVYAEEYPAEKEQPARPIGFNVFPSEAPCFIEDEEDYEPDED